MTIAVLLLLIKGNVALGDVLIASNLKINDLSASGNRKGQLIAYLAFADDLLDVLR